MADDLQAAAPDGSLPSAPAAPPPAQPMQSGGMGDFSDLDPAAATRMFQDPQFLRQAAVIALQHRQPAGLMFLQRAHEAAKENLFMGMSQIEAGDTDGAIQSLNSSGRFRDVTGIQKNEDGTYTVTRQNGPATTFDLGALKKSLLSPAEYFKQVDVEQQNRIRKQQADTMEGFRQNQGDYYRGINQSREDVQAERTRGQIAVQSSRAETAQAKLDAQRQAQETANKYGYAARVAKYNELFTANPPPGVKPEDVGAYAQQRAREELTQIVPSPKGYSVVMGDRNIQEFPDYASAQAGAKAWTSGQPMPQPVPVKAAAPAKPPRQLTPPPPPKPGALTPGTQFTSGMRGAAGIAATPGPTPGDPRAAVQAQADAAMTPALIDLLRRQQPGQ